MANLMGVFLGVLANLIQLINNQLARMGSNSQLRVIRADNLPNGAAALSHLDARDPWIKIPSDRVLKQMPDEVRRKVLALVLHELLHMLETLCTPDEMKQVMQLESTIGQETGVGADAVHQLHNVFEDGRIERTSYSWRPGFELDFHRLLAERRHGIPCLPCLVPGACAGQAHAVQPAVHQVQVPQRKRDAA